MRGAYGGKMNDEVQAMLRGPAAMMDYRIYRRAGFDDLWSITRVVTQYRLWNYRECSDPDVQLLLSHYDSIMPKGTKISYM
jgi:hypothetical protein